MSTGIDLIATERDRQVSEEGWTPEHDAEHENGELALAAMCYAGANVLGHNGQGVPYGWPWDAEWWKPTPGDRVRELVKAGALIAAEIDRIQRATP